MRHSVITTLFLSVLAPLHNRMRLTSLTILALGILGAVSSALRAQGVGGEWNRLNVSAIKLFQSGDYSGAEELAERALRVAERSVGLDHPDVGAILSNLAEALRAQGNHTKAEPLYKRSLEILEKSFGREDPGVATIMNNLALLYKTLGDYAKAEPLYKRSLAIREKVLGPDHLDVAGSLNNLAQLYLSQGGYEKAEPLCKGSLAIFEKVLGPNHPQVATAANNLAVLYKTKGDYTRAEPLYQRALAIRENALGPGDPDVAVSLSNLGDLYTTKGGYEKAEPLYKRSLAISEKALGPNHPQVATVANNLAVLYRTLGDYVKAEPLCKRSLAIREKVLGPNHAEVAASLNNLAEMYTAQGDCAKADPLFDRSLTISEKAFGPYSPAVASILSNMARSYETQGDYAKAESLCKRSLAIRETVLGPDHPDVATSLNNLAEVYTTQGDCAKAEPLFRRSLTILEKAFGPDSSAVASVLSNWARSYEIQGDYTKAEALSERSLAIREMALGPEHSEVAKGGPTHKVGDFGPVSRLRISDATAPRREALIGPVGADYARAAADAKASIAAAKTQLALDTNDKRRARAAGWVLQIQLAAFEPLLMAGDEAGAAECHEAARAIAPDHPDVVAFGLLLELTACGKEQAAMAKAGKPPVLAEEDARALAADGVLATALARHANHPGLLCARAEWERARGRVLSAIRWYREEQPAAPNYVLAWLYLRVHANDKDAAKVLSIVLTGRAYSKLTGGVRDPQEVQRLSELALVYNPEESNAHLMLGQLATVDGRLAEAVRHIERAHKLLPTSDGVRQVYVECLARLGHERLRQRDEAGAAECHEAAKAIAPDHPDVVAFGLLLELAACGDELAALAKAGKPPVLAEDDARALATDGVLATALARHPNHAALLCARAEWERARGRVMSALTGYRKAQAADPSYLLGWLGAARLLRERELFEEAAKFAREGLAHRPDPALRQELALALVGQGRLEGAELELRAYLKLRPGDTDSERILANLLAVRACAKLNEFGADHATIARMIDEALKLNPEEARAQLVLGRLAQQERRTEAAVRHFELAHAKLPQVPEVRQGLVESLFALGWDCQLRHDEDAAVAAWLRCRELAPADFEVEGIKTALQIAWRRHEARGLAALKGGDRAAAAVAFRQCLRIAPDQHWAAWLLATAVCEDPAVDLAELERLCRQALAWQQQHALGRDQQVLLLARTLVRAGKVEDGKALATTYLGAPDVDAKPKILAALQQLVGG